MADETTTNYGWAYPTVNADADTWGTTLNTTIIAIDADLKTVDDGLAARLAAANNLSDLANAGTARTNLGLGNAATATLTATGKPVTVTSTFTANLIPLFGSNGELVDSGASLGSIARTANNLSDLSSASLARSNLGLGSIATHNVTISSSAPSGGSDGDFWYVYVP